MNLGLKNKVVIITGGTGGIGSQIVTDFLNERAIVVCLVRNPTKMEKLKVALNQQQVPTSELHSYSCDLMDYENIKFTMLQISKDLKRIDVLVNCAGFALEYPFALINESQIDSLINLNFKSPILLCQAVLKYMYKNKEGSIINISSVSSVKKGRGIAVYASAKAGLDAFTRTLAIEVGRKNIRVNCIRPGIIETNMSKGVRDRMGETIKSTTSLNRPGTPNEISNMVLFMASSQASSYLTGECINIDGGLY